MGGMGEGMGGGCVGRGGMGEGTRRGRGGGEERNEEVSVCTRPPIVLVHMLGGRCVGKRGW